MGIRKFQGEIKVTKYWSARKFKAFWMWDGRQVLHSNSLLVEGAKLLQVQSLCKVSMPVLYLSLIQIPPLAMGTKTTEQTTAWDFSAQQIRVRVWTIFLNLTIIFCAESFTRLIKYKLDHYLYCQQHICIINTSPRTRLPQHHIAVLFYLHNKNLQNILYWGARTGDGVCANFKNWNFNL